MADVVIYGWERSTYVWTARLACAEKGVSCALEPLDMKSKAHLALHPFGKMPVLRHGDLVLYETSAICRYIDETFGGPALKPVRADKRAVMEQWISALNAYYYEPLIRRFVLQYAFPKGADGQPDRAVIDAALKEARHHLGVLDAALKGRDFLAGEALSIADLFLVPILFYVRLMPEGARLLKPRANLRRVHDALMARPSFAATKPAL
jgi:glutathione S-transferase